MESTIIWLIAGGLIIAVFVPYLLRFRKAQQKAEFRLDEARSLGIDRPRGQFPQINRAICIGCGSCVAACPEADVLAVVWGTAEVVNGDRCVGHGFCEMACPVGALKVGLGDIRTRPDIPILSECNETSVPGVFIAGELSGISLIRHAVGQGQLVAGEIARRCPLNRTANGYDLIVVGAGPAGLTAALTARQRGLSCLVLDQYDIGGTILHYPRRKLVMTQPVEIPLYGSLDRDEYSKEELLAIWQQLAQQSALDIRAGQTVQSVARSEQGFHVATVAGESFHGRFVVLALGRRGSPRKLGVPGEELPKVLYQLVDAQSYRGVKLLVVGGGDSAVEAAVGLARQPGNDVTISYRKPRFFRIKAKNEKVVNELIAGRKIRALFNSGIREIRPSGVVISTPDGDIELLNDIVIVQAGGVPPFDMLEKVGIAFGGDSLTPNEVDTRYSRSAINH